MSDILEQLNAVVDRRGLAPGESLIADAAAEIERLRALLAKAYQFISPHSDPMGISNTQMAAEIMAAISPQQSMTEPK
jgi:hypothetical protein